MNPPPSSPPSVYAQPWAVKLGFALIVAFTLILGLVFFDNAHRKELETVSETTAVGDSHFFQAPTDATRLPAVGAVLDGLPLYVTDVNPIELRDTHTHRMGHDASRSLAIYKLSPTATEAERARLGGKSNAFLLKLGAGQFVVAAPAAGH